MYNIIDLYKHDDYWKKHATKYLISWIILNPLFIILYLVDLFKYPFPKLDNKEKNKLIKKIGYDSKTSMISLLIWIISTGTTIGMEIVNSVSSITTINWEKILCFSTKILSVIMFYVIIVRYVEQLHLAVQINKDSFKLVKILSSIPFINSFAWINNKNIKDNLDELNKVVTNNKQNLTKNELDKKIK